MSCKSDKPTPTEYSSSSGALKRRKRREREEEVKRLPKVCNYFKHPKINNVESKAKEQEEQKIYSIESVQNNNVETESKEQEEQIIYSIEKDNSNDIQNKECEHQNIFCNNANDNYGELPKVKECNPYDKPKNLDDEDEECSAVAVNVVNSIAILIPPKDPGKLPEILTNDFVEACLEKGVEYFQNKETEKFVFSERQFKNEIQKGYLNISLFPKNLCNGETNNVDG